MTRRQVGILGGLIVGAALLAGLGWRSRREPTTAAATSGGSAQAGDRLSYHLSLVTDAHLTLGVGAQSVHEEVQGTLVVTTLDAARRVLTLEGARVQLTVDGRDDAGAASVLAGGLARSFVARYDGHGALATVSVPRDFDPATEAAAHQIAALLQVTAPGTGLAKAPDTWTAREQDGLGTYAARYTRKEHHDDTLTLLKEALSYEQAGQSSGRPAGIVPQPGGALTLTLALPDGALRTADGTQTIELAYAGGGSGGTSTTTVALALTGQDRVGSEALARLASETTAHGLAGPGQQPSESVHARERGEDVQRRALEGKTLQQLVGELEGGGAAGEDGKRKLYLQFRALMLLEPARALDVARYAAGQTAGGTAFDLLVGTLAATGTAEAQAGLRLIIDAVADEPAVAAELVPTLSQVEQPTPETVDYLRKLAAGAGPGTDAGVADGAKLALGTVTSRLLALGETERAQALIAEQTRALGEARSTDDVTLALKALGNGGAPETLAAATPYLGSQDPELRRQAANALRFVQGSGAEDALTQLLAKDGDAAVRSTAAEALAYRPVTDALLAAEQQRFAQETDVAVRLRLLRTIFEARSKLPEQALAFVRQAEAQATEPAVRELAKSLLAGG